MGRLEITLATEGKIYYPFVFLYTDSLLCTLRKDFSWFANIFNTVEREYEICIPEFREADFIHPKTSGKA